MNTPSYLDSDVMNGLETEVFRAATPFPWANPQHLIKPDKFSELVSSLPSHSMFRPFFGKQRKHGQASHDRYVLDYDDSLEIASPWKEFIGELRSPMYRSFVARLLGMADVSFRFHWHFTPPGAQVSPHCDSRKKHGSQIFYLNTNADWNWDWGGETVLLDDGGQLSADSAPSFSDFENAYPAITNDNHSLIFGRRGNSWHGVRKIECPEGYYRKVFIVVFYGEKPTRISKSKNIMRNLKNRFSTKSQATKVKTPRY